MKMLLYSFELRQTFDILQSISGPAEVGVPGVHVHPLFLGDNGTQSNTKFASFLWPISVVHPLILAPYAVPDKDFLSLIPKVGNNLKFYVDLPHISIFGVILKKVKQV